MAFLQSNVPYFKAWVRREYTKNFEEYHGEFLHALAISVTTIPDRSLSFQVVFTGAESYDDDAEQEVKIEEAVLTRNKPHYRYNGRTGEITLVHAEESSTTGDLTADLIADSFGL